MRDYFLVFVQFGIVAKDIAATLEERGLGAPIIGHCEEDALRQVSELDQSASLRLAVIQSDVAVFSQGALYRALKSVGCAIIWVQDAPEQMADQANQFLTLPFFTEDLEQVVARARLTS